MFVKNVLLEMGGKPGMGRGGGMGGWFYIGGDGEIFKVSLNSWQMKANPPVL